MIKTSITFAEIDSIFEKKKHKQAKYHETREKGGRERKMMMNTTQRTMGVLIRDNGQQRNCSANIPKLIGKSTVLAIK